MTEITGVVTMALNILVINTHVKSGAAVLSVSA